MNKTIPAQTLQTQDGKKIKLNALKGITALYFYPKDNTPGCTKQACSLRDGYKKLENNNIAIYGVSGDDEKSHQKFIEKYNLPFSLLIDKDYELSKKLGLFREKLFFGKTIFGIKRTTIILNANKIVAVIEKPDVNNHAQQIIDTVKKLEQ